MRGAQSGRVDCIVRRKGERDLTVEVNAGGGGGGFDESNWQWGTMISWMRIWIQAYHLRKGVQESPVGLTCSFL